MSLEAQVRAEAHNQMVQSLASIDQKKSDTRELIGLVYDLIKTFAPLRDAHPIGRAEFDAILARLAAAEAEIETLKKGQGPETQGA